MAELNKKAMELLKEEWSVLAYFNELTFMEEIAMRDSRARRRRRDESKSRSPGRGSEGDNVRWRIQDRGGSKVRPTGSDEISRDGLTRRGRSQVGHRRSFRDLFRDARRISA